MIIEETDSIRSADGKQIPHRNPETGLRREEFTGKDINDLRSGGQDLYIYQLPDGHDPKLNRLDGVVVLGEYTCTEGCISLTDEELQINIDSKNTSIELGRSGRYRNESDPKFFYWQRGEGTQQEWLDSVAQIREEEPYI